MRERALFVALVVSVAGRMGPTSPSSTLRPNNDLFCALTHTFCCSFGERIAGLGQTSNSRASASDDRPQ